MFNGSYDSSQKKLLTFRKPYFSKGKHLTKKIIKTFWIIFTAQIIFLPLANKHQKLNQLFVAEFVNVSQVMIWKTNRKLLRQEESLSFYND